MIMNGEVRVLHQDSIGLNDVRRRHLFYRSYCVPASEALEPADLLALIIEAESYHFLSVVNGDQTPTYTGYHGPYYAEAINVSSFAISSLSEAMEIVTTWTTEDDPPSSDVQKEVHSRAEEYLGLDTVYRLLDLPVAAQPPWRYLGEYHEFISVSAEGDASLVIATED